MATKSCWFGTYGPAQYDDTDNTTYGDMVTTRGLRVEQGWIEDDPTVGNEIATKNYVDNGDGAGSTALSDHILIDQQFAKSQVMEAFFDIALDATKIKGLWFFDVTTGTTITDRSLLASGHNLTLSLDASAMYPGTTGLARRLTTSVVAPQGYWDTPDHDDFSMDGPKAFTLVWAGIPWDTSTCILMAKFDLTTGLEQREYQFATDGTDILFFRVNSGNTTARIGRKCSTAITPDEGTAHVYIATYSGGTTNAALKIYKDGVRSDDADDGSGVFTDPANTTSKLGCYTTTAAGAKLVGRAKQCVASIIVGEEWSATAAARISKVLQGFMNSLAA